MLTTTSIEISGYRTFSRRSALLASASSCRDRNRSCRCLFIASSWAILPLSSKIELVTRRRVPSPSKKNESGLEISSIMDWRPFACIEKKKTKIGRQVAEVAGELMAAAQECCGHMQKNPQLQQSWRGTTLICFFHPIGYVCPSYSWSLLLTGDLRCGDTEWALLPPPDYGTCLATLSREDPVRPFLPSSAGGDLAQRGLSMPCASSLYPASQLYSRHGRRVCCMTPDLSYDY